MNNIYMIILKYRNVILNGLILFSLIAALFANGDALRSGFLSFGTGVALIIFGESIAEIKKQKVRSDVSKFNNE